MLIKQPWLTALQVLSIHCHQLLYGGGFTNESLCYILDDIPEDGQAWMKRKRSICRELLLQYESYRIFPFNFYSQYTHKYYAYHYHVIKPSLISLKRLEHNTTTSSYLVFNLPFKHLCMVPLPKRALIDILKHHKIFIGKKDSLDDIHIEMSLHQCTSNCSDLSVVFSPMNDVYHSNLLTDGRYVSNNNLASMVHSGHNKLYSSIWIPLTTTIVMAFSMDKKSSQAVGKLYYEFYFTNYDIVQPSTMSDGWHHKLAINGYVLCQIPLAYILQLSLTKSQLRYVALRHGYTAAYCDSMSQKKLINVLKDHDCADCLYPLSLCKGLKQKYTQIENSRSQYEFPPVPPYKQLEEQIIRSFCADSTPEKFEEYGCISCGLLTAREVSSVIQQDDQLLKLLIPKLHGLENVSRIERTDRCKKIQELDGPLLAPGCTRICLKCKQSLKQNKLPLESLANGHWLGEIPLQLKDLSYAEKLLVTRVRHNYCVVRVSMGMHKMKANAIAFRNPTPKIYDILPPPKNEIENILTVLFVGCSAPTTDDLKWTPLLVRHKKVYDALTWLVLNHQNYHNVIISTVNLHTYNDDQIPVPVEWISNSQTGNVDPYVAASNDTNEEEGTHEGACEFTVQGLTDNTVQNFSIEQYKAYALQHLMQGGKILAVGHSAYPESIYDNPQLYPQMFPWLFPYGLGGLKENHDIHQSATTENRKLQMLLLYHDKRFQRDENFPLIVFNHRQIKNSVTGGHLLAKKSIFPKIIDRLDRLDLMTLTDLIERLRKSHVKPLSQQEKDCFDVLSDLDHIAYHVDGSLTSKKYMRNEIWSLISHLGAPTWFITFAPSDTNHPMSIYFASEEEVFRSHVLSNDERQRLIASNPVASARFFHKLVDLFIQHVLGIANEGHGLFGPTGAYYGTVEQQGRLTLHLHLLLWIKGAPSPQIMREKLVNKNSAFHKAIINYLENMHKAGLYGNKQHMDYDDMQYNSKECSNASDSRFTLPLPPPELCPISCQSCDMNTANSNWWKEFQETVDHLNIKCNYHSCSRNKACTPTSCKARFPKEVFKDTIIEDETGHIYVKHIEPMMNKTNPVLTYLMRCNTDVTCLLSGTAMKAVVAYVADYITKPNLKTYGIFDAIRSVLLKQVKINDQELNAQDRSRKLMTRVVNALTSKMEIGAPFAASYLLNLPDHYTSHKFVPFYWKQYLTAVLNTLEENNSNNEHGKYESSEMTRIVKTGENGSYVMYNNTLDYTLRPSRWHDICLHDWISRVQKVRMNNQQIKHIKQSNKDKSVKSDKDDFIDSKTYLPGHPQRFTHCINLHEKADKIPSFIGGPLPRSDKGNREYYCEIMLMLFKPWRTGNDLKQKKQRWDDAFDIYCFSAQQRKLMENFNVRYECHDAKDDFYANNISKSHVLPNWITNDSLEEIEDLNKLSDIAINADGDEVYGFYDNNDSIKGKITKLRESEMTEMQQILEDSGWLDEMISNPDQLSTNVPEIISTSTPAKLHEMLIAEKDRRLTNKTRYGNQDAPAITEEYSEQNNCNLIDNVRLVDKTYLEKDFSFSSQLDADIIDKVVKDKLLNNEQERAFRIIGNHAATLGLPQLTMYLGGMGGTGKSRVIEAVAMMFALRNEHHRFTVIAPTGAAASLLNGSTYHSAMGFHANSEANIEPNSIAKMVSRLRGVEYIFFDEVSMLSCSKLYAIATRLAKLNNNTTAPFGGMNMIFSGDFAQLPPVFEGSSYALYSGTVGAIQTDRHLSNYQISSTVGKSLWHQITTVVILRQNMRQNLQSTEDKQFRTALENMRYGACTKVDIQFLKTLVANKQLHNNNKLATESFRNVSIIVTRNIQRDKINDLGCKRFALQTGQKLYHFYSTDEWHTNRAKNINQSTYKEIQLHEPLQRHVWSLPHSMTNHKPGILKLCKGMPVMIKLNVATECCVTNGSEANVVAWKSHTNNFGLNVLDVLFVELQNPPRPIHLSELPCNVVPLIPVKDIITCTLANDKKISIKRSQVPILPNFAMTDYCSQGRTRKFNVCMLGTSSNSLASHYTSLSRSSSASNTVILQDFDASVLTSGITGYLRQEYRELEILDHITEMRFNKSLPPDITGAYRNDLIKRYRDHYGTRYLHTKAHHALYDISNKNNGTQIERKNDNLSKKRKSTKEHLYDSGVKTISKRHKTIQTNMKRKVEYDGTMPPNKNVKKMKFSHPFRAFSTLEMRFPGFKWDNENWSCAYDSLLFILHSLFIECPEEVHSKYIVNNYMEIFYQLVQRCKSEHLVLEKARDEIRNQLYHNSPTSFPRFGQKLASVVEVCDAILTHSADTKITQQYSCIVCKWMSPSKMISSTIIVNPEYYHSNRITSSLCNTKIYTTEQWLHTIIDSVAFLDCPSCGNSLQHTSELKNIPSFIAFDINTLPATNFVQVSKYLSWTKSLSNLHCDKKYYLKGLIYHGNNHFTSSFISQANTLWYNDGIKHGNSSEQHNITDWSSINISPDNSKACIALYVLDERLMEIESV